MNEISCAICTDLMPLVQDGVASADSCRAVQEHLAHCPRCKALYEGTALPPAAPQDTGGTALFRQLRRRLQLLGGLVMLLGIMLGVNLSAGVDVFYNCLLMPVVGALGYGVFRWKALYQLPLLLFIAHLLTNALYRLRGLEALDLLSLVFWTGLYVLFALAGMAVAGLLHFALKKEKSHGTSNQT